MTTFTAALLAAPWQINPESGVPLPPRWGWYVVLYFFIGGITAGCYAIASALAAFGDPRDRDAVRLGHGLAFPGVLLCALLLVLDLGRPERLWHMVFASHHFPRPILKSWSPISLGSWVLAVFGALAFVSFVGVLVETGRLRWAPVVRVARRLRGLPRPVSLIWTVMGCFFGFLLAGYTGVLMVSSVKPIWHNAVPLGGLFLASAASTSYALLILLLARRGRGHADPTVRKLADADRWAIAIEILLLLLVLVPLGSLAQPFITGAYGALFWLGAVIAGLLAPLVIDLAGRGGDIERKQRLRASLVLAGGLVLRFVIVMAPQAGEIPPWHL